MIHDQGTLKRCGSYVRYLGAQLICQHRCKASHARKTAAKIRKAIPIIGVPLDEDRLLSFKSKTVGELYLAANERAQYPQMVNEVEFEAKLYAFCQRSGLTNIKDSNFLKPAFTIITNPGIFPSEFSRLQTRGNLLINLFVTDYIYDKYPDLSFSLTEPVLQAYTSDEALADVAKILGISQTIMLSKEWKFSNSIGKELTDDISIRSLEAVVGALYVNFGPPEAYKFVKDHILSRKINTYEFILDKHPTASLITLFKVMKKELPVARLLAETGRNSNNPTFVVAIYSGSEKLGEASGHSLLSAEGRACRDILRSHYFNECSNLLPPNYDLLHMNIDGSLLISKNPEKYEMKVKG